MRLFLIFAAGLLASSAALAQPKPFQAEYEVLRNGDRLGQSTIVYRRSGATAEFSTRTRGTAGLAALAGVDIDETSTLLWRNGRPETVNYRFRQKAAWSSRERSVVADAAGKRIVSTNKDQRFEFPYQPGVLDRHAVTLALMLDVGAGAQGTLQYLVADRANLEPQRYQVAAKVRLKTAIGAQPAVRVERLRDSADGKTTRIWFDSQHGFVPLRIIQDDGKGERIEMRITALR